MQHVNQSSTHHTPLHTQAELEGEGLPVGAFRDALNAPRLAHLRLTAEDYEDMEVDDEEEEVRACVWSDVCVWYTCVDDGF